MNSPFRGWASWVIEFLRSPEGGITRVFSLPFGALRNVALAREPQRGLAAVKFRENIMKTQTLISRITWPKTMAGLLRTACAARLLAWLLLLALPAVGEAQFNYTADNGAITITGYTGPGGSVTIPSTIDGLPVTSIGDGAFGGCTSLASVTIPGSVTSIGDEAFASCAGLTSVTIPGSVTNIGVAPFLICTSLTAITVDALNSCYSSVDGVLFDKSQATLIQSPGSKAGSYTVPNSVISIGDKAFYACTSLTSVTIPGSVTSIGDEAFASCAGLTSVTIPGSVTNIGVAPFLICTSLTAITVDALNPCYSSVDGVLFDKSQATLIQSPGSKAGSYTVPSSVTSIGAWAFCGCFSLTSVTIPNSVTSIGDEAFNSCRGLTSVTIPSSVASMADYAFGWCASLKAVYFQGNAPSADSSVFAGDQDATVYYLPGTTGWGPLFGGLPTALWNAGTFGALQVSISPPSVVSAGAQWQVDGGAWQNSGTIVSNLPVGSHTVAFSTVPGWITPTNQSVTITLNQTTAAAGTYVAVVSGFNYTTNNGAITITGYTGSGGAVTIPSTINGLLVASIGDGAFGGCTSLASVSIPDGVANIGFAAFDSCSSLSSVTIGNAVTSIGQKAFAYCPSLISVYFQGNAPNADSSVFTGDNDATVYYLPGTTGWGATFGGCPAVLWSPPVQGYTYTTTNRAVTITKYTGSGGAVTIPSTINGLPVTSIGDNAFYCCTNLAGVTIPDTVTNIGDGAFQGCLSLATATIGNSVTSIGSYAFYACDSLTSLTIPNSVTSIGYEAFFYCVHLASIAIPDSVTSVGDCAFSYCASLASATIGNSVTSIGYMAFYCCTSLTSATMGNSVASIGAWAFDGCTGLTSVTIPKSVTSIADWALPHCASLTAITVDALNASYSSVAGVLFNKTQTTLIQCPGGEAGSYTIPNSVTSIGNGAFYGCANLTSVAIPNSVTSIGYMAFYCCTSLTSITIPNSVSRIGTNAFEGCSSLTGAYFQGNAPNADSSVFSGDNNATVYYLPGTTGWGTTFGGCPTVLSVPPSILVPPLTQTAEMGSLAGFWLEATNIAPAAAYQWYFDGTNALGGATNCYLVLPNVQPAQVGAYTVVVTNLFGAVTSAPALLSVIAPVEQRIVPALSLTGDAGSFLHLDYVDAFGPGAQWLSLSNFTLASTPQLYLDLSEPLPAQRFYRASQTNVPSAKPVLDMRLATEIPLTGAIGSSVQVDYINQFGPTDAWVTLDTVVLTNTTQLYFDVTMFRQPTRLYRLVAVP